MNLLNFFNTFRGRLLVVFAVLLITTLGVQYYLNVRAENENKALRERQEKTLVAGVTLGFNSISSDDRLSVFKETQPYFQEYKERIADIVIIDDEWQVYDSFNPAYLPRQGESGEQKFKKLSELRDLPPLLDADALGADRIQFPNVVTPEKDAGAGETHAIPLQTNEGRWYVLVVMKSERGAGERRAAERLVYTLLVISASIIAAIILVWRFTRPIKNLSDAAQSVAEGDLSVRVPHTERSDEMGRLAARFNEMIVQLENTRKLEAELQEAEKSAVVGRLGSAIAHEIRNPLNYINLTLDHLRAKFTPQDEEKHEQFERLTSQLKTEVARINQQITDFLRYSRPLTLTRHPTQIVRIVEDSMRIVEAQAAEQNVFISIVERDEIPAVLGDGEYLRSVFNNLFVNAVQAMADGGNLTVTLESENGMVKIEVADTGNGIPEKNLHKIFEPYFSTKETGTGLGLAIVKKIVDDHNGTIDVASKVNEGTIFTVRLPRAK